MVARAPRRRLGTDPTALTRPSSAHDPPTAGPGERHTDLEAGTQKIRQGIPPHILLTDTRERHEWRDYVGSIKRAHKPRPVLGRCAPMSDPWPVLGTSGLPGDRSACQ